MFLYYDTNGDGYLNKKEWTTVCKAAYPDISNKDVNMIFNKLDTDGDKLISWSELYANIDKVEEIGDHVLPN